MVPSRRPVPSYLRPSLSPVWTAVWWVSSTETVVDEGLCVQRVSVVVMVSDEVMENVWPLLIGVKTWMKAGMDQPRSHAPSRKMERVRVTEIV